MAVKVVCTPPAPSPHASFLVTLACPKYRPNLQNCVPRLLRYCAHAKQRGKVTGVPCVPPLAADGGRQAPPPRRPRAPMSLRTYWKRRSKLAAVTRVCRVLAIFAALSQHLILDSMSGFVADQLHQRQRGEELNEKLGGLRIATAPGRTRVFIRGHT